MNNLWQLPGDPISTCGCCRRNQDLGLFLVDEIPDERCNLHDLTKARGMEPKNRVRVPWGTLRKAFFEPLGVAPNSTVHKPRQRCDRDSENRRQKQPQM